MTGLPPKPPRQSVRASPWHVHHTSTKRPWVAGKTYQNANLLLDVEGPTFAFTALHARLR